MLCAEAGLGDHRPCVGGTGCISDSQHALNWAGYTQSQRASFWQREQKQLGAVSVQGLVLLDGATGERHGSLED